MEKAVIHINQYKLTSLSQNKRLLGHKSFSDFFLVNDIDNRRKVGFGELVSFIIDYGVKFQEEETEEFNEYMLEHHKTIEFYGVKYHLPLHNFNDKEQKIFDYLIENYILEIKILF